LQCPSVGAVLISLTAGLAAGHAQTVPGSGMSLSGTWALDTYLSDSPGQVAETLRIDLGPRSREGELGRMGRGADGTGRTGSGGSGRGRARAQPVETGQKEDPKRKELLDAVRFPPLTLTLSETDGSTLLTDSMGFTRTFRPNGKKEPQQFHAGAITTRTTWQGPQLVIEYDLGQDTWLKYTYSLVPTTKQLLMRVTVESNQEQLAPFEIKQVYNRVPPHE
jgi:hypothetical protein